MSKNKKMSAAIFIALFAALISVGSFIHIPMPSGVPITVQDMLARLAGILLGSVLGGAAVLLFLLIGFIGFPVFTGKAGIAVLLNGPTGGFLVGYFVAAVLCGAMIRWFYPTNLADDSDEIRRRKNQIQWLVLIITAFAGTIAIFAFGVVRFLQVTNMSLAEALPVVVLPFIPGAIIKTIMIAILAKRFIPVMKNYL